MYSIYAFHSGGANLLLADGSAHFAAQSDSAGLVAALTTRAGAEVISGDY
jgi:prepilin-type processing-associated H-X9-DG protein